MYYFSHNIGLLPSQTTTIATIIVVIVVFCLWFCVVQITPKSEPVTSRDKIFESENANRWGSRQ